MTSRLFSPLKVGSIEIQNRVALAPLTRLRADENHVPLPFVADYYAQRASDPGTLLISEGACISPQGIGMEHTPGLWSKEQLASWKVVTDAVHAKGSFIFAQLWALGRQAQPAVAAKHGVDVISSGDVPMRSVAVNDKGDIIRKGEVVPRPLTEEEIQKTIGEYAQAARNAVAAGFDGVEIHGANGYLVDQFIQTNANNRSDRWGGSIENRSRFAVEVAKAVSDAVGADKTGIRLSPWGTYGGMRMEEPRAQFAHVVGELKKLNLAFLHLVEPRVDGGSDKEGLVGGDSNDFLIDIWDNVSPVLLAGGITPAIAFETVDKLYPNKDIIAVFGRHFISNPDIVYKLRKGIPFTPYNRATFYIPYSEKGYTDYPFSEEFKQEYPSRL